MTSPSDDVFTSSIFFIAWGGRLPAASLHRITPCAYRERPLAVPEPVRYRVAAVAPEVSARHLDAGRGLAPLVLCGIEQVLDPGHELERIALRDDVRDGQFLLHQVLEHRVQLLVGWQAVLVLLVRPQLR